MKERARRIPANMNVTLVGIGRTTQACLLDVSRGGLKIASSDTFRPGQRLTVLAVGLILEGEIRWTGVGMFGMELSVPLHAEQQAALADMTRAA